MATKIDRSSSIPYYEQLKQILLERFEQGEFPAGQLIPPEMELAKVYRLSRASVRRAMQELEHEGYIHRTRGKGTFVLRTHIKRGLSHLTSFSEAMQERGQVIESKILSFDQQVPPPAIAEKFNLEPGQTVLSIHRLRMSEGQPIALNISYVRLPEDVVITEEELTAANSLWTLLDHKGLRLIESDKVIVAILANEERAQLLNVEVGAPLLLVGGMAYSINHMPVEYSQVISSGDRYEYTLHLER